MSLNSQDTDGATAEFARRYQIKEKIGAGSFGQVSEVVAEDGRTLVCKTMAQESCSLEDAIHEVTVLEHLQPHCNVVRLVDAWVVKFAYCLIMEHGGDNLHTLLNNEDFDGGRVGCDLVRRTNCVFLYHHKRKTKHTHTYKHKQTDRQTDRQ